MAILTYLLVALGLLWFLDEILTVLDLRKGFTEGNPIAKIVIKHGKVFFTEFKFLTFVVYVGIILFINSMHTGLAAALTAAAVGMSLVVVVRNLMFYRLS